MHFLLGTNVLIPLEDSAIPLRDSLANFVRLATANKHVLVYHPASIDDIEEDKDDARRRHTLQRLRQYTMLEHRPACPWTVRHVDGKALQLFRRNAQASLRELL